jgi:hypothetical protein
MIINNRAKLDLGLLGDTTFLGCNHRTMAENAVKKSSCEKAG